MSKWHWAIADWDGSRRSQSVRRRLIERYGWWQLHASRMDHWWGLRQDEAEALVLTLAQHESDRVRNYIHTTRALAVAGRRDNARFQLLVLLQTRVLMGDPRTEPGVLFWCCDCGKGLAPEQAHIPHSGKPEPGGPFCKECLDAAVDREAGA